MTRNIFRAASSTLTNIGVQYPIALNLQGLLTSRPFSKVIHGCGDRTLGAINYL